MPKQLQFSMLDIQEGLESEPLPQKISAALPKAAPVPLYQNIGDVAKLLDVPTHVLRFWESKFSEIKPIKRSNGHRYYRAQDIETIRKIKALLYEQKFTISGAKAALKNKETVQPQSVPSKKTKSPLEAEIRQILKTVDALRHNLRQQA